MRAVLEPAVSHAALLQGRERFPTAADGISWRNLQDAAASVTSTLRLVQMSSPTVIWHLLTVLKTYFLLRCNCLLDYFSFFLLYQAEAQGLAKCLYSSM